MENVTMTDEKMAEATAARSAAASALLRLISIESLLQVEGSIDSKEAAIILNCYSILARPRT
jgi:hypothetical protein